MTAATVTEPRSWETRRSAFRHDWLKNTYLNRLNGFLSGLDATRPDREWLLEFVEEDLLAWEEKRSEARWLIDAYENEMSPRTLLGRPPLVRLPLDTRQWLGDLVHALWCERYATGDATENARAALGEADAQYGQLVKQISDAPDVAQLKALRPQFVAFRDACVELGNTMTDFLREVKAT